MTVAGDLLHCSTAARRPPRTSCLHRLGARPCGAGPSLPRLVQPVHLVHLNSSHRRRSPERASYCAPASKPHLYRTAAWRTVRLSLPLGALGFTFANTKCRDLHINSVSNPRIRTCKSKKIDRKCHLPSIFLDLQMPFGNLRNSAIIRTRC